MRVYLLHLLEITDTELCLERPSRSFPPNDDNDGVCNAHEIKLAEAKDISHAGEIYQRRPLRLDS